MFSLNQIITCVQNTFMCRLYMRSFVRTRSFLRIWSNKMKTYIFKIILCERNDLQVQDILSKQDHSCTRRLRPTDNNVCSITCKQDVQMFIVHRRTGWIILQRNDTRCKLNCTDEILCDAAGYLTRTRSFLVQSYLVQQDYKLCAQDNVFLWGITCFPNV